MFEEYIGKWLIRRDGYIIFITKLEIKGQWPHPRITIINGFKRINERTLRYVIDYNLRSPDNLKRYKQIGIKQASWLSKKAIKTIFKEK